MSLKAAILDTGPTSYWPMDDGAGDSCHDEAGLHDAAMTGAGVKLAAIPFGAASAPYFDGEIGSVLTVADDIQYSQPYANALTVAAWICPLTLDNAQTTGTRDQYVHFIGKAVDSTNEVEWAMRLYNRTNPEPAFAAFILHVQAGLAARRGERRLHGVRFFGQ